jgi:Zn-dependent M28 family amino/carboxypeptidase
MKSHMLRAGAVAMAFIVLIAVAACSNKKKQAATSRERAATMGVMVAPDQLTKHIVYLSSDELGGRGVGSKGEEMTLTYLSEQYAALGLRPGNPDGTYIQAVPLIGSTVTNRPVLELKKGRETLRFRYGEDFMCWTRRVEPRVPVEDADVVFVGYGVVAPEYNWDDFKNVDVTGKIIVMLVGDPPVPDTTLFAGRAMTYYGRWTYKYEIAAAKGAAGAVIVHNEAAAGYPFEVVTNSWTGEQFDIVRPNKGMNQCALEGWITEDAAKKLFARADLSIDEAYRRALSRGFTPMPLASKASATIESSFRDLRSYNVVALIEGQDPKLKNEYVIYSAHWDHLGIGLPAEGDSIYNGALDNASGVAATLELARLFSENRDKLRRSVLILNTTAEESGLLGAYHYAENPLYPLDKTAAEINIDGINIWGRTTDVVVVGYGFSDLDGCLADALESQGRRVAPDAEPQKGFYYRSDHFPFAKKGVPALYADSGVDHVSRPPGWGLEARKKYTAENYHKPSDEYDAAWDLMGAVDDIEALFRVGLIVATQDGLPQWSERSEFKQVREQSLRAVQ